MALTKVTSGVRTLGTGEVTAANLASGVVDTTGLQDDVALLAFKTQANGSLARYNLVDQSVDAFEDASGVDDSASSSQARSGSNYYYGGAAVVASGGTITTDGSYTIHSFLSGTSNYVNDTTQATDILVVAGGGGASSGGGGAGGMLTSAALSVSAGTYSVTVGTGVGVLSARGAV